MWGAHKIVVQSLNHPLKLWPLPLILIPVHMKVLIIPDKCSHQEVASSMNRVLICIGSIGEFVSRWQGVVRFNWGLRLNERGSR